MYDEGGDGEEEHGMSAFSEQATTFASCPPRRERREHRLRVVALDKTYDTIERCVTEIFVATSSREEATCQFLVAERQVLMALKTRREAENAAQREMEEVHHREALGGGEEMPGVPSNSGEASAAARNNDE